MRELRHISLGEFARSHLPPLLAAAVAVVFFILTPLWAKEWMDTPFLGFGLEHTNVVNQLDGTNWPGRKRAVSFQDRLVALDGTPVSNAHETQALMKVRGFQRAMATFERQDGSQFTAAIVPIKPPFRDLISLFIVPYTVAVIFVVIGLWTYSSRPRAWESRALLLFVSGASVMLSTFLDVNTTHHATFWFTVAILVAAGGLFYLALVFPEPVSFVRRRPGLRYLPWLFLAPFSVLMYVMVYHPPDPWSFLIAFQAGYIFIILGFILFIRMLAWRMNRSPSPLIRQQSRVILFGGFVGFLPVLTFLGSVVIGRVPIFRAWVYFPPLILFPLSITYAILRYRLLDIDSLLARLVTYTLMTAIVVAGFFGLAAGVSLLLEDVTPSRDPRLIVVYLLALIVWLNPLREAIQRGIDRFFYRAPTDYRAALSRLSRNLLITPDLSDTMVLIEEQLERSLAPDHFLAYLYNDDLQEYIPHATRADSAPPYPVDDPLIRLLGASQGGIWLPPDGQVPQELLPSKEAYRRFAGFAFAPLHYEGKMVGFLALGPRRSGDLYTSNDLDFLSAVAAQSTLALENARLFTNQRRILDQTREMKNLMDDIFASMATGVITTDLERHITLFNRAAERIFRITGREALGKPLADLVPCLGQELDQAAAALLREEETRVNREFSCELPGRGEVILYAVIAPLRDARLETIGAAIVFDDLTEQRRLEGEQERIRETFGRVVAPRVRDRLLAAGSNLKLDGTTQTVTILFADLTGFTAYSEMHTPEEVFPRLNFYLSLAAQAILEREGTLDKFMGDAAMAMWNAPDAQPDHAWRAVCAALEIVQRSRAANLASDGKAHKMVFRIGISTGPAMIGNVGTDELFNYTAIGDAVNVAQRLQTHADGGEILLERATYEAVAHRVVAERLRPIKVKGRAHAVEVYKLTGFK